MPANPERGDRRVRIVFMGTPEFAVPSLRELHRRGFRIEAVVTQPDRPRGRGHRVLPTPVALEAERLGLPVYKPARVSEPEFAGELRRLEPDAIALVAFGQLIPKAILELPRLGCVNVHPSLLPRYRGASPIHAPILAGDAETGVTTMLMDEGLDTGDILMQERVPIAPHEHAGDLHDRLAALGARLLAETLDGLAAGRLVPVPQDDALASYAPKVQKVELDWSLPHETVARTIRGLSPFPGVYTFRGEQRLKLHRAVPGRGDPAQAAPGEVLAVGEEGIAVACGEGSVLVTEVQPEGKAVMRAADFARGYRVAAGERWGRSA